MSQHEHLKHYIGRIVIGDGKAGRVIAISYYHQALICENPDTSRFSILPEHATILTPELNELIRELWQNPRVATCDDCGDVYPDMGRCPLCGAIAKPKPILKCPCRYCPDTCECGGE
jgi:hypothetical protein